MTNLSPTDSAGSTRVAATRAPGMWLVHGPSDSRAGWAVGRAIYGMAPFFSRSTQWMLRADGKWRQWRSQEAAQRVADQLNEENGLPSQLVVVPAEFARYEDAYIEGFLGLHGTSPYVPGCDLDLAWRAGSSAANEAQAGEASAKGNGSLT